MSTAQQIFIVYGTFSIAYGMVLGLPISQVRLAGPTMPRHLMTGHISALMQGAMHLGLAVAVGYAALSPWWATAAAVAAVAGSACFAAGVTANWLMKVEDHFVTKPVGFWLLSVSSPLHLGGVTVLLVGVVRAALR